MTLATQLIGVLGAVVLVSLLVQGTLTRATFAASTAALATVVVALLGLQGLFPAAKLALANAKAQRALTPAQIAAGSSAGLGINGAFIDWGLGQMGAGTEPFFVVGTNPTAAQYMANNALPRLMATRRQDATWIVFYDTTPRKAGYRRAQFASYAKYQPTFSIARLKRPKP
jgi:hypothetical protein